MSSSEQQELSLRFATVEDKEWIEKEYLTFVSRYYEDSDRSYCDLWWESFFRQDNSVGFFSLSKEVLVFHQEGMDVGFFVITHKRGGSAKVAPVALKVYGEFLNAWALVEEYARERNVRKLYFDVPSNRWQFARILHSTQVKIEAQLERQYSSRYDSIVAGKFLSSSPATLVPSAILDRKGMVQGGQWFGWERLNERHRPLLVRYVRDVLSHAYGDLDETFVDSLYAGMKTISQSFKRKGKLVFVAPVNGQSELQGLCVLTPKRGGAMKLAPLQLNPTLPSEIVCKAVLDLLQIVKDSELAPRKLYSLVPWYEYDLQIALRRFGFKAEGLLKEVYRPSVDMVFYGLFP